MGRGTTPIQAMLMGRVAAGSDINPISVLMARPRIHAPSIDDMCARLQQIPLSCAVAAADCGLRVFYHPHVLAQLLALKRWFIQREAQACLDGVDDWIRMVCLSRLSGHSPGFFSVRTMPPNQAVSIATQTKLNKKHRLTPPDKDVRSLIVRRTRSLLRSSLPATHRDCRFAVGRADDLHHIKSNSVHLIVTSPPFLDVVDYRKDNWLRCWFAGIDAHRLPMDVHRSPAKWADFVRRCFCEFASVVRPGGHVAFEVGEVRGGRVLLEQLVLDAVAGLPFKLSRVLINRQSFTKTAHCWGVSNNKQGTNTNRIALFQRLAGAGQSQGEVCATLR